MATFTDDFNRSTLGANWTAINSGDWSIASSVRAQQTQTTGTYRALRYATPLDSADIDVSAVINVNAANIGAGLLVRMPGSGTASTDIDGYAIIGFPSDTFYLLRMDSGNDGGIGYGNTWGTCNASTNYTLRITVEGSTVTAYIDGVQRIQVTDTTYAGGSGQRSVALLSYGATPTWDNFSAADIVSGVTGSAAITQAAQTVSAAGVVAVRGSAAITQAANTLAATGTVPLADITGSAAITQAAQTVAAAGVVAVSGSAAITQAGNSVTLPHALRFYGNATSQIDRVRIPLEDGVSTQYPPNVGAADFTVEAWLRCAYADNDSTATDEDARYSNIVYDRDSWGEQRGHVWGVTRSGTDLIACFGQAGSGGSWSTIFSTSDIGDEEWHHVAVTRTVSTGVVRIWVDGVQEASATYDTADWSFPAGHTVGTGQDNEYAVIGTEKHDVGFGYNGQLDELRISDSVRYTGAFTPLRRFEPDANAVGLYHLDDATGTVASDSATVAGAPTNGELLVGGSPSGPVWVELPAGIVESAPGIVGAADLTQAAQTVAATGVVAVVGAASITQAAQTVSAAGVVAVVGAADLTQDGQTVLAVGVVAVVGAAALTQASNTVVAAGIVGNVPIIGSASMTQDGQTVSAVGVVAVVGSAALTQDGNTLAAAGVVAVVGSASMTQASNTVVAAGYVGNVPIIGSASMTQAAQTVSAAGVVAVVGSAALTQDGNTVAAAGAVAVVGSASMTQAGNTLAGTMALDLVLAIVLGTVVGAGRRGTMSGARATGSSE